MCPCTWAWCQTIHPHLTLFRGWGRGQTIRRDNRVVLAVIEKGRNCGAPQKGYIIAAPGDRASATAAGLCMNEKAPPLESHSPLHACQRAGCREQTHDLILGDCWYVRPNHTDFLDNEVRGHWPLKEIDSQVPKPSVGPPSPPLLPSHFHCRGAEERAL